MPDLLQGGVSTVGGGGGAGAGGKNLLVVDGGVGVEAGPLQAQGQRIGPAAVITWYYDAGLGIVHLLQHLGEDGGIVHTAVLVIVQPLGQHRGDVLELGSLEDQQSELSSESMSYCGGGGAEHRHTEHRGVLGQAGHWAGLQGPRHLR